MRSFSFAGRGERLFKVVLNVTPTAINKCVWQDVVKQDKMIDRGKVALRDAIDHQKWFWLLRRALGVGRVMSIHSFIQHFQLMGPSNHIDPLINWSMDRVFIKYCVLFSKILNIFWTLRSLQCMYWPRCQCVCTPDSRESSLTEFRKIATFKGKTQYLMYLEKEPTILLYVNCDKCS